MGKLGDEARVYMQNVTRVYFLCKNWLTHIYQFLHTQPLKMYFFKALNV